MIQGLFLFAVALVAVGLAVATYNRLVTLKHAVTKTWANIDVLLKQRHDELPKLVEACKQYRDFERDTLERVMKARAAAATAREAGDVDGVGKAESMMRVGLGRLFAVAEAYPQLRTSEVFQRLQGRISDLENAIADRREFYNETVNNYNVGIERFPDVIFARLFNFAGARLLQFGATETVDVELKALFARE